MNRATLIRKPGVEALLDVLYQERRVLERLLFRVGQAGMLVAANEHRYLAMAIDEVSDIEHELGKVEILRAILVAGLAARWEVPEATLTISQIAELAPDHAETLRDAGSELTGLIQTISGLKEAIAQQSGQRRQAATKAIDRLSSQGFAGTYDRAGGGSPNWA